MRSRLSSSGKSPSRSAARPAPSARPAPVEVAGSRLGARPRETASPKAPASSASPKTKEGASPKGRATDAASKPRLSPRGRALPLTEGGAAAGSPAARRTAKPLAAAEAKGGGAADGAKHRALVETHAMLQQAHTALQEEHRESVASCLLLLDQLQELQHTPRAPPPPPPAEATPRDAPPLPAGEAPSRAASGGSGGGTSRRLSLLSPRAHAVMDQEGGAQHASSVVAGVSSSRATTQRGSPSPRGGSLHRTYSGESGGASGDVGDADAAALDAAGWRVAAKAEAAAEEAAAEAYGGGGYGDEYDDDDDDDDDDPVAGGGLLGRRYPALEWSGGMGDEGDDWYGDDDGVGGVGGVWGHGGALDRPPRYGYDEDDPGDPDDRLTRAEAERLLTQMLHTQQRADELERENAELKQTLIDQARKDPEQKTLVIQVSSELW